MGQTTTPSWPVAFSRLEVGPDDFLRHFPCNHIHGVYGDHIEEWRTFAQLMGMDVQVLRPCELHA